MSEFIEELKETLNGKDPALSQMLLAMAGGFENINEGMKNVITEIGAHEKRIEELEGQKAMDKVIMDAIKDIEYRPPALTDEFLWVRAWCAGKSWVHADSCLEEFRKRFRKAP